MNDFDNKPKRRFGRWFVGQMGFSNMLDALKYQREQIERRQQREALERLAQIEAEKQQKLFD